MDQAHQNSWESLQSFANGVAHMIKSTGPPRGAFGAGYNQGYEHQQAALDAIRQAVKLHQIVDELQLLAVKGARIADIPWAEIAMAAGVTRQAAWERWHEVTAPLEAAES